MRLHHLRIEAFGPFATAVDIDFDDLSDAGLFLLSGPTGAGKSSVLDAICFALYGDVPGDRSSAKRLRCDRAAPLATPRVTLEATLSGRRFKLVRSPSWDRPKLRGQGTTTQQSSVTLSERVGDAWQPLSSRIDETGDLVTSVVGMNLAQFTQVAMLPQGRFQAFLRAKSEERHQLLQRLFRTGRFEQVERWLRDRRLALSHEHQVLHQQTADLVSRVSEAAGEPLPDGWDVHDLTPAVDDGSLLLWSAEQLRVARESRADGLGACERSSEAESEARSLLEHARALVERHRRYASARRDLDGLEAGAAQHLSDQQRLDRAHRGAPVVGLHEVTLAARDRAGQARTARGAAFADVRAAGLGPEASDPTRADLETWAHDHAVAAAAVRALQPRAVRHDQACAALDSVTQRRARVTAELQTARAEHAVLPEQVAGLRAALAEASAAQARATTLRESCQTAQARLEAHRRADRLRLEVVEAQREWLDARGHTLMLRERLIALQDARIEGMAAELAGSLAAGCHCPVCGSAEHPAKAAAAPDAPDAAAERAARSDIDSAAVLELAFDQKVRELESSLASVAAVAGDLSPEALRADLGEWTADLDEVTLLAGRLPSLESELAAAEQALTDLAARLTDLVDRTARADAEHAALTDEVAGLRAEIDAALEGTDHQDLEQLLSRHQTCERLARTALERDRAAEAADEALREATERAEKAALEAGFDTAAEAAAAALSAEARARLAESVAAHEQQLMGLRAVLAEPGADDVLVTSLPDVDGLLQAHRATLVERDRTAAELRVWTGREERLTGLVAALEEVLTTWRPLRESLTTLTQLCGFVEGKSADNQLRMRLSAYVLAYRLSQVVAAANERLARMSDQRYSLEHTGRRGAGESRGGLSLLVRDDWSGESRDPATLSGGETFVVSLALALGLSDVITQEAGGAALDTLFVDEGFGSLDAETLDDVMDTLDSLRDGGRVVGVVSHVAEMRDRIPTQLVVTKSRSGSSVHVRR